jgi:hypothetical protein
MLKRLALELITCLLQVLRNFVEVDEAMFQSVERPYELIFSILSDLDEIT